jgi:hypothetical protein
LLSSAKAQDLRLPVAGCGVIRFIEFIELFGFIEFVGLLEVMELPGCVVAGLPEILPFATLEGRLVSQKLRMTSKGGFLYVLCLPRHSFSDVVCLCGEQVIIL